MDIPIRIEIIRYYSNSNLLDVLIYYSNGKVIDKQLTKNDLLISYKELLSDF